MFVTFFTLFLDAARPELYEVSNALLLHYKS